MSEKLKTAAQLSISGATDYAVIELGDLSIYYGYEYKYCESHGFNFEKHCDCQGLDSLFIKYKDNIIFSLSKKQIQDESEDTNRIDSPERYALAGLTMWLNKIGYEYIIELSKLTMNKKPEEIQTVPVTKKPKLSTKKSKPKAAVSPLRGKLIVFSGFRDNMMERLIVQKGGIIANSVGYNTDYLVIPDELRRDITTKINKANRFGVEIKRRSQFLVLINT